MLGGDAAESWAIHAKDAKRETGMSMVDFLAAYEKYGSSLLGGSAYDKTKRMVNNGGLTVDEWAAFRESADADKNGNVNKGEVTDYIEAHFSQDRWYDIFEAYKGGSNWKNPY